MGFNTVWIRLLVIEIVVMLLSPLPALASAPGDVYQDNTRLQATAAQTITIPFSFEIIDYSGYGGPSLPSIDFSTIAFINQAGSIAVTIFSLLDQYYVLGIFVVILAGLGVIFWLWTTVSGQPSKVERLNLSEGISAGAGLYYDTQNYSLQSEINAIEGQTFDDGRVILAGPTVSLNKSLMGSNRKSAAKWRRGAGLLKRATRLRW